VAMGWWCWTLLVGELVVEVEVVVVVVVVVGWLLEEWW